MVDHRGLIEAPERHPPRNNILGGASIHLSHSGRSSLQHGSYRNNVITTTDDAGLGFLWPDWMVMAMRR